jgi:hypothetical protein
MRFHEFFQDSDQHLSMSRLGMFIGIVVGAIVTLIAGALYFFHSFDASVFQTIYQTFLGTSGTGYGVGKVADIFTGSGPTAAPTNVEEDATP